MILRSLAPQAAQSNVARPAYEVFLDNQSHVTPEFIAIPQPSHAHVSGALASHLLPDLFGPLPEEVIEAARQHDYGLMQVDLAQLLHGDHARLRPFPALSPKEAVPAWEATVRLAEFTSPLIGVLVNRHFCLLSDDRQPIHVAFREAAESRRFPVENKLGIAATDLERWTAALGVCDLLSLYLCSGSREAAEFPFCHPADRSARGQVERTVLRWDGERLVFSKPLLNEGAVVTQSLPPFDGQQAVTLSWNV